MCAIAEVCVFVQMPSPRAIMVDGRADLAKLIVKHGGRVMSFPPPCLCSAIQARATNWIRRAEKSTHVLFQAGYICALLGTPHTTVPVHSKQFDSWVNRIQRGERIRLGLL